MKKYIVASLVTMGLGIASFALAQGMMGYSQTSTSSQSPTIDSALQSIYQSQSISSEDKIDCSKVTDDQFETLGDAVMGYGISEQQHAAMENMMGGEGSATLRQAHITLGRAYIGCWAGYNSGPVWMPMMSNYATTNPVTGYYPGINMMKTWYANTDHYVAPFIWIWVLFCAIGGIIWLAVGILICLWLWKQIKKR